MTAAGSGQTTVLVTGASGSIGLAVIDRLGSRGVRMATIDKDPLPARVARLVALNCDADLNDDNAVQNAVASVAELGALAHVIAIAGGGDAEELGQDDPATEPVSVFSRVLANNLTSAFTTIRHVVPRLRESGGDRSITLVGSINAYGGYGAPAYSAAKAGLGGLAKALAPVLGADGVRINCLALGTVDTENLRRLDQFQGSALDLAAVAARAPLRRVLTPEDVASSLTAMALDMPGLTGTTVVLDNGQTLIR